MKWFYFFLICSTIIACQDEGEIEPLYLPDLMEIPKGFPAVIAPEGNEFTQVRWELGKKLFFDPILSADSSISCASCHHPQLAFSDNLPFSLGVGDAIGTRNASPLANVAYHPYFTREGGVPTLEMQIFVPIQEHNEFNFNILLIAERLKQNAEYVNMAQKAYEREPDAFVITRSLACFERSLLSGYSPYDQYQNYAKTDALSEAAINGMSLFFGERTNCSTCHSGFNFTNYAFENNGLYEDYPDEGRFRLTSNEADRALLKVPSLRNIELTAPYMHDGSMQTLEEVVSHYQSGGKNHPHKSELLKPMDLTVKEQQELIAFLKSLTDETFVNNPIFSN